MEGKKKRLLLLGVLSLSLFSIIGFVWQANFKELGKISSSHTTTNTRKGLNTDLQEIAKEKESPKESSWQLLSEDNLFTIDQWAPNSIKIMFKVFIGEKKHYLVSEKRVNKRKRLKKDNKWEFPGGRVDHGESPIGALFRELREEDESLILYKSLRKSIKKNKDIFFRNIRFRSGEHITLLKTGLSEKKWLKLKKYYRRNQINNKETYGFRIIKEKFVSFYKSSMKDRWTPKSIKIIKRLRFGSQSI